MKIEILYEDAQVIVCVKPSGMASQPERSSAMDLVSWLKNYRTERDGRRGGAPYIGVVHRLDRPVGGIMVYAKTPEAAAGLSRQFSEHRTEKTYLALLTGELPKAEGLLENRLEKNGRTNRSEVVASGGKKARLAYRTLEKKDGRSLVEVKLDTGRHHQIRVQTSHAGAGIYGDMKYNREGTERWNRERNLSGKPSGLGLFSAGLAFDHPVTGQRLTFKFLPDWGSGSIDGWTSLSYYMNDENN